MKARVLSHEKNIMVEKLSRINGIAPSGIVSVGDSSTDLSMMIPGSSFIGFNPARELASKSFRDAGVPIVEGRDLRGIWPHIFNGEVFPE